MAEKVGNEKMVESIIAGFAGTSSLIKADSVIALSVLLKNLD